MEGLLEFQRVNRALYHASWVLLLLIAGCTAVHNHSGAGWITYLLTGIYGIYLYYHTKYGKPTTFYYFVAEAILILLLDRVNGSPLVINMFLLLILRRASNSRNPDVYLDTVLIGGVYLAGRLLYNQQIYYPDWVYAVNDLFLMGLTALLVQRVLKLTKSLQADREKLRLCLNNAEASYQKAAELALRDGLTGLYNYRALQEHISNIGDTGFAILLIDVDHFKEFNDQYGHVVGDQVLAQIAQVILENVRRSDKVYRYGGEEFAVVLEDTDDEVAIFTAERIRLRVANQALQSGGQLLRSVTISSGVAVFKETKISSHQVLEQADKALYKAKAKGRNNVVFFIEPQLALH